MKRVEIDINLKQSNEIINGLANAGFCADEVIPGALLDNIFFDLGPAPGLKLGRKKLRQYVMLLEHYVNSWSSVTRFIMTDSEKEYRDTLSAYVRDYEAYLAWEKDREKTIAALTA